MTNIDLTSFSKHGKDEHFNHYLTSLNLYWQGQFEQSLDKVCEEVASPQASIYLFSYYRLWIETIKYDDKSLRSLLGHLWHLASEAAASEPWLALRGLIYMELDEWQACEVIYSALKEKKNIAVIDEFCLRYQMRINLLNSQGIEEFNVGSIHDFFHLQSICQALLLHGNQAAMEKVLVAIDHEFPGSPIVDQFVAMQCLEQGLFAGGENHLKALKSRFPKQSDYWFWLGYAQLMQLNFKDAITSLTKADELSQGNDPDTTNLLAYCHSARSEGDIFSSHWQKSKALHIKAKGQYETLGLPTIDVSLRLRTQQDYEKSQNPNVTQISKPSPNFWSIHLGARESFELQDSSVDQIEYLFRSMGKDAKTGDVVFIFKNDYNDKNNIRLVALYQVSANTVFDPIQRYLTPLNLIYRFDLPVKIPIKFRANTRKVEQRNAGRLRREETPGVFSLNEAAFTLIKDCVKDLEDEISQEFMQWTLKFA